MPSRHGFVIVALVFCVVGVSLAGEQPRMTYQEQIQGLSDSESYGHWRPMKADPQAEAIIKYRSLPDDFFRNRLRGKITQTENAIYFEGELSSITFDRKSGGVKSVRMRDVAFADVWLAEPVICAGEEVFRGRDFAGKTTVRETDEFIFLEGAYSVVRADGSKFGEVKITYQIDPYTGFVQQFFEAVSALPSVTKLSFLFSLGAGSAKKLPDLFTVDEGGQWFNGGNMYYQELYPAKPALVMPGSTKGGGRLYCAKQTDGRIALEIICPGWWNVDFDEAATSDVKNDMFMRMGVREADEAFMNIHFINRQEGKEIPAATTYRTTFSVLPFKKLRPFAVSYAGHSQMGGDTVGAVKLEAEHMKQLAGMGATMWQGAGGTFKRIDEAGHEQMSNTELAPPGLAHWWGLQSMYYIGQNGQIKVKFLNDDYTKDDARRDFFAQNFAKPNAMFNPGIWDDSQPFFPPHDEPDRPVYVCINAPKWRKFVLKNIKENILDRYPDLDTLYVDDMCQYQCTNPLHGCAALGSTWWIGQYDYIRQIRQWMDEKPGNQYFTSHESLTFMNTHTHAGLNVGGETAQCLPVDVVGELNTGYNFSLLYGVQNLYYTASGGMGMVFDMRLYELALSRCNQVLFNKYFDMPGWDPGFRNEGRRSSYDQADIERHQKYMGPLQIFDIARSELHHPFDSEFKDYCVANVPGIVPVLYARPNDVLLTIAREGVPVKRSADKPAVFDTIRAYDPIEPELNLNKLGFTSDDVLVYETTRHEIRRYRAEGGILKLPKTDVNDGPRIFRVIAAPAVPQVLWHDVVGWRVAEVITDGPGRFKFQMAGAPGHSGKIYVLSAGRGMPEAVNGDAKLIAYNLEEELSEIEVQYSSETALAEVDIAYPSR
jgi:hypothetical protein